MQNVALAAVLLAAASCSAAAQSPASDRPYEDSYRNDLLYVHALVNYAWDLESQFDWERRQFAGNALRVNTGSVSSDLLFTDIDLRFNQPLNEQWRFTGSFDRDAQRRRPITEERLLLGFERHILNASALFVTVNPEFNKAFLDLDLGYAWYSDNREQYLRLSVLLEDFNFESKNDVGGLQEQSAVSLNWAVRWSITQRWFLYSEGSVGPGFERRFNDAGLSPELAALEQNSDRAELRFSNRRDDGSLWSIFAAWADFGERRTLRSPGIHYDYSNTEINFGAEHIRLLGNRHRLRLLAHYVDRKADSVGFNAHEYSRKELAGGAFYEYLWPNSGVTLAYALGQPDFEYRAEELANSYQGGDDSDKLIAGWRYTFSENALLRASISHEVSAKGFGGGGVQFQVFF